MAPKKSDIIRFNKALRHLKEYKSGYGHCDVPFRYKASDGFALGVWVASRRKAQKNGKLAQDKFEQLDQMGVVW